MEIYPLAPLLADKELAAEQVIDDLQADLGAGLFADGGGPFELRYDAPSQCLLVRLPQAQQRALEGLLASYGR